MAARQKNVAERQVSQVRLDVEIRSQVRAEVERVMPGIVRELVAQRMERGATALELGRARRG